MYTFNVYDPDTGSPWEDEDDLDGDELDYELYCIACEQNDMMPVPFDDWKQGMR